MEVVLAVALICLAVFCGPFLLVAIWNMGKARRLMDELHRLNMIGMMKHMELREKEQKEVSHD